jgi:hypothetical protein
MAPSLTGCPRRAEARVLSLPGSLRLTRLSLAWPPGTRPARPLPVVPVRFEAAVRVAHREVRRLAFRHLSLLPRQRRANQRPMSPVMIGEVVVGVAIVGRIGIVISRSKRDGRFRLGGGGKIGQCGGIGFVVDERQGCRSSSTRPHQALGYIGQHAGGLLAARGRDFAAFVLVLRVAGGTARLFHLFLDHGNDRMVGYAALTRAVVV